MSICKDCFHSYVCEQFNKHRECDNKKCHFFNDHFVPTADVIEIVQCKDCAYFYVEKQDEDFPFCCLHHSGPMGTSPNHFCGYGKRKGGVK